MHDNPPVTMIISIVTVVRYIQRKRNKKKHFLSLSFFRQKNRNNFFSFWKVNQDSDVTTAFGVGVGHKFVTA